jgi:hypothetical protein
MIQKIKDWFNNYWKELLEEWEHDKVVKAEAKQAGRQEKLRQAKLTEVHKQKQLGKFKRKNNTELSKSGGMPDLFGDNSNKKDESFDSYMKNFNKDLEKLCGG